MPTASAISEEVFVLGSTLKDPSARHDRIYILKKHYIKVQSGAVLSVIVF